MTNQIANKKIFIETYGCQMNEYDTELVKSILLKENYSFVKEDDADIVLLNTCAIRENAHRKVYGRIHEIRHRRRQGAPETKIPGDSGKLGNWGTGGQRNDPIIGILGCMATNLRTELLENRNLKIDFIAGPDSYKRLPQLIAEALNIEDRGSKIENRKAYDVTLSEFETYSDVYPQREKGVNAWIAVSRGCNNFCTFCVVPYTRGRERSRSVENVMEEARRLAAEGFKQVTLLGQNVNSYFHEGSDFAALMEAVSRVEGIERVRFTSPHPKDFPKKFLDLMAGNPKICKHIHLPLQAGNTRVLHMMNRTYTQEEFLNLVDKIRSQIPHIALTTDIIVGFPTETDEEFKETVEVMKTVEFDSAFIFKYSERKGTIAQKKFPDDVPEAIKTERIVLLNEIQKEISLKKNRAHIDKIHSILLESEETARSSHESQGRTDGNKLVIIPSGQSKAGDFLKVKITDATPHVLRGESIPS